MVNPWHQTQQEQSVAKPAVTVCSVMRPILQTNINFNPGMDKYIHYKMWDEIIYIHTQTSIQQPFQFGNGYVVSSHILLNM